MGFANRRSIELFYDMDDKNLIKSTTELTLVASPAAFMTEEVSIKLNLLYRDGNTGQISPYQLRDSQNAVFMTTVNAPDTELQTTAANPVVGYSYGSDGTLLVENQIGTINLNIDFPLIATVAIGDRYLIGTNVTDNAGVTYTNTGQIFTVGQYIVWTGKYWYIKTGTPGPDEILDHIQGLNTLYDWVDIQRNGESYSVISSDPLYNVITSVGHGLGVGDIIIPYANGAITTPIGTSITADTRYWVKEVIDVDTFKITSIPNGDNEVVLSAGTFYFKKSFANISQGRFSIRLRTTPAMLKTTWTSPLQCSLVLSSLTSNDEVYTNAPPYFLSNLVVIPFILNSLPWVEYDNLQPPDLILTYPTTAAVLSMLSVYMHKVTAVGATNKIPIIDSGGELIPSLYTTDTIKQLDNITAPLGNTSINVGGFDYTLDNIGNLTLNANNTILKTLGIMPTNASVVTGNITIASTMVTITTSDASDLITITGGAVGKLLYVNTSVANGIRFNTGGNININGPAVLSSTDFFIFIYLGTSWTPILISNSSIDLFTAWAFN